MVNLWMWENFSVPISVTLGQGHQPTEAGQILPCPHGKVRATHPIATKLGRYITLVMLSTWLNSPEKFCLKLFLNEFLRKILNAFWGMGLQGQIWNLLYLSQKWFNCHDIKSKHIDWTLGLKWDHRVWPWPWPWPWIFKVKCGIRYISAKNGPIATKQKANI